MIIPVVVLLILFPEFFAFEDIAEAMHSRKGGNGGKDLIPNNNNLNNNSKDISLWIPDLNNNDLNNLNNNIEVGQINQLELFQQEDNINLSEISVNDSQHNNLEVTQNAFVDATLDHQDDLQNNVQANNNENIQANQVLNEQIQQAVPEAESAINMINEFRPQNNGGIFYYLIRFSIFASSLAFIYFFIKNNSQNLDGMKKQIVSMNENLKNITDRVSQQNRLISDLSSRVNNNNNFIQRYLSNPFLVATSFTTGLGLNKIYRILKE
jgi:hypothetical protein